MALITYREMQRRVGRRIQNLDTSTTNDNDILPKIKDWLNERYTRVINAKPWSDLTRTTTLQIVLSQKEYSLPRNIGQIIKVFDKTNGRPINQIDIHRHIRNRAASLDQADNIQTGDPTSFYEVGKYTCGAETGSTAEKVSVVSSSSSDSSPKVLHIKGLVSAVEIEEDIVLTGTSSVDSSNTWDASQKLQVSIGTNDGTEPSLVGVVTVTGKTSSNAISKISPFEIATEYRWIEVSPTPDSDATQPVWDIWYRREIDPLKDDNDIPFIDCCDALVYGAYADALREDGQESKAETADNRWVALIEELWASRQNPDFVQGFQPRDVDNVLMDGYGRFINIS